MTVEKKICLVDIRKIEDDWERELETRKQEIENLK